MDTYMLISALSVMHCWNICTALPAGETQPRRHVRTKRCSCATFMDNECVYFCHLDIIWVNTPERVVAYGLGSAPRTRRAAADHPDARCRCLQPDDVACRDFCQLETRTRLDASPDARIRSTGIRSTGIPSTGIPSMGIRSTGIRSMEQQLAANSDRIKRTRNGREKRVSPPALRAALRTRLLLKKWRARPRHRARAWEGESAAS